MRQVKKRSISWDWTYPIEQQKNSRFECRLAFTPIKIPVQNVVQQNDDDF